MLYFKKYSITPLLVGKYKHVQHVETFPYKTSKHALRQLSSSSKVGCVVLLYTWLKHASMGLLGGLAHPLGPLVGLALANGLLSNTTEEKDLQTSWRT